MRPLLLLLIFLAAILAADFGMALHSQQLRKERNDRVDKLQSLVGDLGITDLCLTTEARYTRHLAVSDSMAPFMDHPGAIDHFPSGSFFSPVSQP